MRSLVRTALILPFLVAVHGCGHGEGGYVIRGTVRAPGADGTLVPVSRATVHADGGRGGSSRPVETGDDGTFRVEYLYGGIVLPFYFAGNDDPEMVVSATGYQPCRVRLKRDRAEPGISRTSCTHCRAGRWGNCCGFDAVLQRVTSAAPE